MTNLGEGALKTVFFLTLPQFHVVFAPGAFFVDFDVFLKEK
jgi:hypothetical protein